MRAQYVRPWCIKDVVSGAGSGTQRPIGVGLTQTDKIAQWNLRQWNWRIHGSVNIPAGAPILFDVSLASDAVGPILMANERSPICSGIVGAAGVCILPQGGGVDLIVSLQVGSTALSFSDKTIYVIISDGLQYYPMNLLIRLTGHDSLYEIYTLQGLTPPSPVSAASATFSGLPVDMFATSNDLEGNIAVVAPLTDGYFEFLDANGNNPVFDKDTGAQLISPVPRF